MLSKEFKLISCMEFNSFFIKNITDNISIYNITLAIKNTDNIISITDIRNGEFAKIVLPYEEVTFWINYLAKKITTHLTSCFKTDKFDSEYFYKVFVEVVKQREKVKGTIKKRDIFRFDIIQKLKHQGFLCSNVKGFFPETKFFLLPNGRIKDSRTGNAIQYEQEEKVWDFLYQNQDRVGKDISPSIYDYCAGKRIILLINGEERKATINYIYDLKNGSYKIKIHYNGQYKELDQFFTKEELINRVIEAR